MMRPLFLCFTIAFFSTANAAGTPALQKETTVFSDSMQVKVISKGSIIKTSLNGCYRAETLSAGANDLHFYVFDLSGTLMHRATLSEKEKCRLPVLQKGVYLYDVFKNDLSIEEGRIVIE